MNKSKDHLTIVQSKNCTKKSKDYYTIVQSRTIL